jgi:integrase
MSRSWDLGLDYRQVYRMILAKVKEHISRRAFASYCYACVLLIQLRNGSRVSEAVDAAIKFADQKSSEVYVKVRKRRDGYERLMVLPEELKIQDISICREILSRGNAALRVKVYAKKVLGINTHSLRYARITHMLRNNISPSIVAKITGHKKLDYILTYTQIKTAEEALRNIK